MTGTNFRHADPDDFHGKELSLHDCISDKLSVKGNTLRFYLPDGFWVTPRHGANASDEVIRTGASAVEFSVEDINDTTVRVFTQKPWPCSQKTIVETWDAEMLMAAVNSGKCTVEFVTQYRAHCEQMWYCVIHSDKKPYYRECQLYLPNANATFYWNDLCPDRVF